MRKISLIPCYLISVLLFCGQLASGQNLYIEITDALTYRSLSNVSVELKSEQALITLIASPRGEVIENVPAGIYYITLTRTGYETKFLDRVEIKSYEITTLSISLQPEQEIIDPPRDITQYDHDKKIISARPSNKKFVDFLWQTGNIQSMQAGYGLFVFQELYAKISYSFSRQSYASLFFETSQDYSLSFHNLNIALGYEYSYPLINSLGVTVYPELYLGMEFLNSKSAIGQDNVSYIMNPLLRPGISAGFYYNSISLLVGFNYSQWISQPMTYDRYGLYDNDSDMPLSWNDDLFPGRKGLGIQLGIRYGF